MDELPGLSLPALATWLDAEHPGVRSGELQAQVIAGGKSNLTYRVSDGTAMWALRRPPLGHVLETAHDMVREYRVISALTGTQVPVPSAVALCTDPTVLGAQFYLMDFVPGRVLDQPEDIAALAPADARSASAVLVDTLLQLHEVDPETVGLGDFGRPEGFLARQVKRWHTQWVASETRPVPELAGLVELLQATVPPQSAPGIVHGDYRLTNVIYAPDLHDVAAVVDWEMATIGDPLADLGLLYVYHRLSETSDAVMPVLSPDQGFLTPDELLARYAAGTSRDLSAVDWYIGFGYFKLAVIAEGISARYLQGKTVGEGFDKFTELAPELIGAGLARLRSAG
jgi:aminoglycoside phosphotransferase (APT) family kinase protein